MLQDETWLLGNMPGALDAEAVGRPFVRTALRSGWLHRLLLSVVRVCMLLASDLAALFGAAALGYLGWGYLVLHQPLAPYTELVPLLPLFPLAFAAAGLYPGLGLGAVETLRRFFYYISIAFLLLGASSFVLKATPVHSRTVFVIAWLGALVLVPLSRFLLLSLAHGFRWWGEPTVILGNRGQAELTIRALRSALSLGYRVAGVLSTDGQRFGDTIEGVAVLGGKDLVPRLSGFGISTALVWDTPDAGPLLGWLQQRFQHVIILRDEKSLPLEQVRVRNLGGVLGIEFTNQLLRKSNRTLKRALDLAVGALLLVAALPLIALGALAVKLASPGPAFYSQERRGLGGRKFRVWKLRTMYPDAERRLREFLARNPELRREWEENMKLARDPRIIPWVGTFLRRFSIDELPQLLSVLGGAMSLVGPRPFPDYHLDMFDADFRELRTMVRPGLTGMWQVMARGTGGLEPQKMFDTYYIRNWSSWLDLYLLVRTVFAVLAARGAC